MSKNQSIHTDFEQYSIYYKNIIYPYSEEYDVQIECEFGKNLGNCWRLEEFNDIADTFAYVENLWILRQIAH